MEGMRFAFPTSPPAGLSRALHSEILHSLAIDGGGQIKTRKECRRDRVGCTVTTLSTQPTNQPILNMTATNKQITVTVSASTKAFIAECQSLYGAAGKTTEYKPASEKEITNALVEFAKANREQTRIVPATDESGNAIVDDDGNPVMVQESFDAFEREMKRELALREVTVRANSAKAENEALKAQLAELQAKLAALSGAGAA